jgi:hypothetical protein
LKTSLCRGETYRPGHENLPVEGALEGCSGKQAKKTRFHEHSPCVRGVAAAEHGSRINSYDSKAATLLGFKRFAAVSVRLRSHATPHQYFVLFDREAIACGIDRVFGAIPEGEEKLNPAPQRPGFFMTFAAEDGVFLRHCKKGP